MSLPIQNRKDGQLPVFIVSDTCARRFGTAGIVDPRRETTIRKADVDMVLIGTPIDLRRVIKIDKPSRRVRYELQEIGRPTLKDILMAKFGKKK